MSKPDYEEHEEVENEMLDETEESDSVEHDDDEHHGHDEGDDTGTGSNVERPESPEPPLEAEFIVEEIGDGGESSVQAREHDSDPSLGYQGARLKMMRNRFVDDEDLVVSSSVTEIVPEAPDLIVCPKCSSEEVRGHNFCSQCNARLPNLPVIEQKYNPGSIDGAARKYIDAVNKLQSEEWSVDDFNDFLNKGLERVQKHAETMASLSEDNVIGEWLPDAADLMSDATQQWFRAVESMLEKVDHCHEDYDEDMAHYEELGEEELEEQDPPLSLEDRVRMTDFNPEIDAIFEANNKMLEYLRILDDNTKSAAQVGGVSY